MLEEVDTFFLRSLFKSHSKTSVIFLHLETATWPIRFIIASRRLNYLHNILKRKDNEVISRVYHAQKEKPLKGDFVELVKSDFDLINEKYDENLIRNMSKSKFKKYVKSKISNAVFQFLLTEKEELSKIKTIQYKKFKLQKYFKSNLFSNYEVQILSKLRSRNINVKANFKKQYTFNNIEKLECSLGCQEIETQQHLLTCKPLLNELKDLRSNVSYNDIFSTIKKQKSVVVQYIRLLDARNQLLEED